MIATDLRPGDVLSYRPLKGWGDPWWCKDGRAVVQDDGKAFDTYWNDGLRPTSEDHRVTDKELSEAEVLFNIGDYDELDRYKPGSERTWETYHPDDRRALRCHNGYHTRWFVRKGAKPDLETQIDNAKAEVEKAESELRSAERQLHLRREDLAKLEAQRPSQALSERSIEEEER